MRIGKLFRKFCVSTKVCIVKGICFVVLFSAVYSALGNAYRSHVSFFKKSPVAAVDFFMSAISKLPYYYTFLTYTGLDTGYGFFSPNVSSEFIILHKMYKGGKQNTASSSSFFQTKEGRMRFSNLNAIYMDKIEEIENDTLKLDTLRTAFLNVIVKRMNSFHLEKMHLDSIRTTVYLYHFPFLREYPHTTPQLFTIASDTKTYGH